MKYMGSKRAMLLNGLGEMIEREVASANRFVDLFTGSGAVARHVAQRFEVPVMAADLQSYSVALAGAVVRRRRRLDGAEIWRSWHCEAEGFRNEIGRIPATPESLSRQSVASIRAWCERQSHLPITLAYGGHYFSASQAVWLDSLRANLPATPTFRDVALAALIQAASHCAASPGHTAQPFQPTQSAKKYLLDAWRRDVIKQTESNLLTLSAMTAKKKGLATKTDANVLAGRLNEGDLVFVDPPYSGVHYSRFYHVLESVASGCPGEVTGIGRYPMASERPRSRYSLVTESVAAFDHLLETISRQGARVIVTFPDHQCSNGLSGDMVQSIASNYFYVNRKTVASRFSSLGGTSDQRGNQAGRRARSDASELILTLSPLP